MKVRGAVGRCCCGGGGGDPGTCQGPPVGSTFDFLPRLETFVDNSYGWIFAGTTNYAAIAGGELRVYHPVQTGINAITVSANYYDQEQFSSPAAWSMVYEEDVTFDLGGAAIDSTTYEHKTTIEHSEFGPFNVIESLIRHYDDLGTTRHDISLDGRTPITLSANNFTLKLEATPTTNKLYLDGILQDTNTMASRTLTDCSLWASKLFYRRTGGSVAGSPNTTVMWTADNVSIQATY
jgi:hypothetical protein